MADKVFLDNLHADDRLETLDKYAEDDFLGILTRCGLFIGAIFQVICIASSILLKVPKAPHHGEEQKSRLQKLRKQEKKKRR